MNEANRYETLRPTSYAINGLYIWGWGMVLRVEPNIVFTWKLVLAKIKLGHPTTGNNYYQLPGCQPGGHGEMTSSDLVSPASALRKS